MKKETRVSIIRCAEYSRALLDDVMMQSLANLGLSPSVFKNARVAVKPNLLRSSEVGRAVITHPEFFRAAVRMVKSSGGTPVLVESPAFQSLDRVMRRAGYDRVVDEEELEVWDCRETIILHNDAARRFRRFEVAAPLAEADIILNLPKFKTHGLTCLTIAVKNIFGTIRGMEKSKWHLRARSGEEFSEFLLDLYEAMITGFKKKKTMIHLVDAIVGMDGEGPGPAGSPRGMGLVIAGLDAIAVDFVGAAVVGIDRSRVHTIEYGAKRKLGGASFEEIEIVGGRIEEFLVRDFAPPRAAIHSDLSKRGFISTILKNLLVPRPYPSAKRCTLCYQCRSMCPAGAIGEARSSKRIPEYDYDRCIRCYCCMEICPEAAISIRRTALQRLMGGA